ncbi:hypothetical protein ACGFIF_28795 [Kribbella sp. NPDC049174]|uniref:hypothetical protein n=1 Tax=Kribbella sp. NPDC049174 TaxID=3364112 RepID=UPI00371F6425
MSAGEDVAAVARPWSAWPVADSSDGGLDEFDLDLVFGELDQHDIALYLPTGREIPGETCNTNNATCPNTCHATCPDTCRATCPNTCRATCPETCRATCRETCHHPTQANTHCFTCRSGCVEP